MKIFPTGLGVGGLCELLLGTMIGLIILLVVMNGCEILPTVRHGPRPAEVKEQKW